jgi:hypothetical protein
MSNVMRQKRMDAYCLEMSEAKRFYELNEFNSAFYHLERAHILGQNYMIPHTKSHWWMLKVGFKTHDFKEIFGQVTRMIASVLFSKVWVPTGNTGGAYVSPFKPMPVPDDLNKLIN